jgi:hypothetical protein
VLRRACALSIAGLVLAGGPAPASARQPCWDRCYDLEHEANAINSSCLHATTASERADCARVPALASEGDALEAECGCRRLLERERRVGVGLSVGLPEFVPRLTVDVDLWGDVWTAAAFVGGGLAATRDPASDGRTASVWTYEVGAQLRRYVWGSFSRFGIAVAAQALWARAQVEDLRLGSGATVPGLTLGPMIVVRTPSVPILGALEVMGGAGYVTYDLREGGGGRLVAIGSFGFERLF